MAQLLHTPTHRMALQRRYAPLLFAFLMATLMSAVMSGALTAIHTGLDAGLAARWLHAFGLAWAFAFPLAALVAPRVRAFVDSITH